jgi:hypothetical protein
MTKAFKKYLDNFMKIFLDEFTMYSDMMILGFIGSKEKKLRNPKKIQVILNMPLLKNPQQIQIFNGMA